MSFLLDTNLLSATAPARRIEEDAPKQAARAWLAAQADHIFLPAIAIGEIAAGIGAREAAGATRHAMELAAWLQAMLTAHPHRILPFDTAAALHLRALNAKARRAGHAPSFADLGIAAIARQHGLTVATRNTKDFAPMGIETIDPFQLSPPPAPP